MTAQERAQIFAMEWGLDLTSGQAKDVQDIVESAQRDAYNAAIADAAKKARDDAAYYRGNEMYPAFGLNAIASECDRLADLIEALKK